MILNFLFLHIYYIFTFYSYIFITYLLFILTYLHIMYHDLKLFILTYLLSSVVEMCQLKPFTNTQIIDLKFEYYKDFGIVALFFPIYA